MISSNVNILIYFIIFLSFFQNFLSLRLHTISNSWSKSNLFAPHTYSSISYVNSLSEFEYSLSNQQFSSGLYFPYHQPIQSSSPSSSSFPPSYLSPESIDLFKNPFTLPNFDRDITLSNSFDEQIINTLLGIEFHSETILRKDIITMIKAMLAYESTSKIICRLALLSNVRCPKWHEDYVNIRLIKTYYGIGTEWIDPGNRQVRLQNWIHSITGDHIEIDRNYIRRMNTGDTFVMSGRNRKDRFGNSVVPILHRSPLEEQEQEDDYGHGHGHSNCRRLLFTITVN